ncbi:metal ABC transporter solute-binding protein, Zn/Mn family [Bacillus sp. V59.32b]|uniref:metal ABC transporter solute-binding protein, Zn/Mn family n=1 Tax=Bacillus sp. V59.32b TaxID=1758642 RepID=UPI000E3DD01F|nr:zinc ABC transporter substrate-binding protein [Bacillus sp. V59.32b]RFU60175.1 adhesin [Bacillus sp. V59.32b]
MRTKAVILSILSTILILSGCSEKEDTAGDKNDDKIKIFATVFPLKDFADKIGGKYVEVETVYPPGTDEHTFEPSQKDIIKMAESDLFFYIGHNLEGFVTKAEPILQQEGVQLTAVGEKIEMEHENEHASHEDENEDSHGHEDDGHNHGDVNPHLWMDPIYSMEMAGIIKESLIEQMPEQKAYFEDNYSILENQLQELDGEFKAAVENSKTNKIIVSHGAYGYWEKRYGIEQISVTGLSGSSEPSQKQLEEIIETAKDNDLQYIIFEQNTSSKLTEIIQNEIGAKPLRLHNLSVLTEKDIENDEDYFSLMNQNAVTLKTALH